MKATIKTNSEHKSVRITANSDQVMAFAIQDGEHWFTIGTDFDSISDAISAARHDLRAQGYELNEDDVTAIAPIL